MFSVTKATKSHGGLVLHAGTFVDGASDDVLKVGSTVDCLVEPETRAMHARIHSAGHLLDEAMSMCGIDLLPGKGCHFPGNAWVEYVGALDKDASTSLAPRLEAAAAELISKDIETGVHMMTRAEVAEVCGCDASHFPKDTPIRIVSVAQGSRPCPCGGTHVKRTSVIGGLKILNIRVKKGHSRVKYEVVNE